MAGKRVLIVGGVAGGASCAARLRRLDESAEIFIFERGGYVSFSNCGLPYYVGRVIRKRQDLLIATPERFRDLFNIEVRTGREVQRIDRRRRTVEVKNIQTGQVSEESYDALVLSPGAAPIRPSLEGVGREGVFTLRNMEDVDAIYAWIDHREAERAVVVGAGFIGLEMVENLAGRGMEVTLIEKAEQAMTPMDPEMLTPLYKALRAKGVQFRLGDGLARIEQDSEGMLQVITESSAVCPADLVILAVGVRPEVALAAKAGLEIGSLGGIRVDKGMRTSDPNIWAVGDAVEVEDFTVGGWTLVPLAGPANRQGRIAADRICGRESVFRGVQGSSVVGLFGVTLAMTGASEKRLRGAGIEYRKTYTHSPDHAGYYPGAEMMAIKLLYTPAEGCILGAQAVGGAGVAKRIDVISMAIQTGATVFDLEEAELCYAPQFGSAKDPVNMAGFVAANELRGDVEVVNWDDWQTARAAGREPLVLDVRGAVPGAAVVPGAIHIPLPELRRRLDELPREKKIWVHCSVGRTSYFACRVLTQHGFDVANLSGGIRSYGMLPGE